MNAADERALILRRRLRRDGLLTPEVAAQLEVPWRTHGFIVQLVFFVLTSLGVAALAFLLDEIRVPLAGPIAGLAAIALAEYFIHVRRWFFTGVEAALWLGGLIAMITELPNSGLPESNLVLAAACAIAGARVRQPLIGAAAAIFVLHYFEERFDLGVLAAIAIGAVAMLLLLREWRRPTTEWLLMAIALLMPLAGYDHADPIWRNLTILLYGAYGAGAFYLAWTRRHHAFFFSALFALAIAAIEAGELVKLPAEAKLAAAGAFLLALTYAAARALRDRTSGIVATKSRELESLELLATISAQPVATPGTAGEKPGGEFGGAGASGSF